MPFGEGRRLGPVGDHDVVPLPLEDLEVIVRPRARHPVRILRSLVIAGAARERHHDRDLEYLGEPHGLLPDRAVPLAELGVRVKRVAVLAQAADHQSS